ncbi:GlcNAc-PI de-N-acetylase [Clostridia bacterium]|nr:GlcNAc-PI de-N-acetylase [Clostridia bacterium]
MNILGIGCHPDDLEIGCGGTLAKYAKQGHKVFMCHVANGDLGHKIFMPEELAKIRAKESEAAAKVLGAESICVDVGDSQVESSVKATRDKLVNVVRDTKADLIITHNPDDYMRDHMQTSELAYDASFCNTLPHLFTEAAETDTFAPLFYMDTLAGVGFIPTEYVDITDEIEQKLEALACHESQIKWMLEHDHIDFLDFVRTCSKYRGLQSSCEYAEGFRQYAGWPRFRTYRLLP